MGYPDPVPTFIAWFQIWVIVTPFFATIIHSVTNFSLYLHRLISCRQYSVASLTLQNSSFDSASCIRTHISQADQQLTFGATVISKMTYCMGGTFWSSFENKCVGIFIEIRWNVVVWGSGWNASSAVSAILFLFI